MFITADKLLDGRCDPMAMWHVISFYWEDFAPHLEVFDFREKELLELKLESLSFVASEEKYCVGYFRGSEYLPCPTASRVSAFSQCPSCASSWIPYQECLFEPKCDGGLCSIDFCRRPHVVYAAAIRESIKIGMTGETRLKERGIEQGADAILPLATCRNRLEARNLEKKISSMLRLPQAPSSSDISKFFMKPPSKNRIADLLASVRYRTSRFLRKVDGEILFLDEYPVKQYLDKPVNLKPCYGEHVGEVIGIKGRYLLYESESQKKYVIINVSDLLGRYLYSALENDKKEHKDLEGVL
ncbi:MAG: DUF2797 domain-containing protein [Methanomassiliicoccales archaeon]